MTSPTPLPYLERIRNYYLALGYDTPYCWANFDEVPFTPPSRPLSSSRIALVTTGARFDPALGEQGPGADYNAGAKFFSVYSESIQGNTDVRISHVGYDRKHTTAEDPACWFPLDALQRAVCQGLAGAVSPHFHGLPTNRSQPTTLETDSPELLRRLQADQADAAILVANCPVCHQCCSLAARHLEAHGIPTVVMGCARDIVEHVGVPRLLFSDFPLGNGAGRPGDPEGQFETIKLALELLATAEAPRTTWTSPLRWADNDHWKTDFYDISRLSEEELKNLRRDFDRQKQVARQRRQSAKS